MHCGICKKPFTAYEEMRKPATYDGDYWCKPCQDEFDQIDWEEVYERNNRNGYIE